MTLKDFNEKYEYKSDKDKFGYTEVWEVGTPDKDGVYRMDCESYMLTLLDLDLISSETELYYCKINGEGHCIGVLGDKVIDCNCQEWMHINNYTEKYNMTNMRKYWKVEIWYKLVTTKLFGRVPFVT